MRFSHGRKAAHCGMRRGRPRGHALAHCCAVLASANPIGRVCVCVKTQVECEFHDFSKRFVCLGRGWGDGGPGARQHGIPKSEKRTMVSII